ncbi:MAG: TonB family protein [Deltaproteobacteria bacterium]|nr:TonB family protein [Deltaproteobacteria bacterium]
MLISPIIPSLDEVGKSITKTFFVELVKRSSKKETSTPAASPDKKEADKKINGQVKKLIIPQVFETVVPKEKPQITAIEPVMAAAAENEVIEALVVHTGNEPKAEPETEPETPLDASGEEAVKNEVLEEGSEIPVSLSGREEAFLSVKEVNYSLILEKIEAAKLYPRVARKRGVEGVAVVKFSIAPDGNVSEIMIEQASGYSILDKAAIKSIKRAAPFPQYDSMLKVEITFKLT